MSARIVVTLVCEYKGEDVDDYDAAMQQALHLVQGAGDELEAGRDAVQVLDVTVTG